MSASGTQISALMRDLRGILEDVTREQRDRRDSDPSFRYPNPEWRTLYRRGEIVQGIAWGIQTARAWPELLARLVSVGASDAVGQIAACEPASIGDAWDACKRLFGESA